MTLSSAASAQMGKFDGENLFKNDEPQRPESAKPDMN